jgi:hypothetical protein
MVCNLHASGDTAAAVDISLIVIYPSKTKFGLYPFLNKKKMRLYPAWNILL